jgi:two-component system, chemotaxis family, protein-glutamate methylesterase/glutaminase
LPAAFPASILLTIHLPAEYPSTLDHLLSRAGRLPATFATDGEPLRRSHIHIAPPGRHLIVDGARLSLGPGPRENNAKPAIDAMLRSAALCCGARAIGVVLTGTLYDGASGLWALSRCGGIAVVQDPDDAAFPDMPEAALDRVQADHVVRAADLPRLLESLVQQPAGHGAAVPHGLKYEVDVARGRGSSMRDMDRIGERSVLTCPDCDGVLWEIDEDNLLRYRCHLGHAYTAELMSVALDESVRRALGSALRALEERIALMQKLGKQAQDKGSTRAAASWEQKARELEHEAEVIRRAITQVEAIAERARPAA